MVACLVDSGFELTSFLSWSCRGCLSGRVSLSSRGGLSSHGSVSSHGGLSGRELFC